MQSNTRNKNVDKIINVYFKVDKLPVSGVVLCSFSDVSKQDSNLVVYIPEENKEKFSNFLISAFSSHATHLTELLKDGDGILVEFANKFLPVSYSEYLLEKHGSIESIVDFYGIEGYTSEEIPSNVEPDFFFNGIGEEENFVDESSLEVSPIVTEEETYITDKFEETEDEEDLEEDEMTAVDRVKDKSISNTIDEEAQSKIMDDLFGTSVSTNECSSCYNNEEENFFYEEGRVGESEVEPELPEEGRVKVRIEEEKEYKETPSAPNIIDDKSEEKVACTVITDDKEIKSKDVINNSPVELKAPISSPSKEEVQHKIEPSKELVKLSLVIKKIEDNYLNCMSKESLDVFTTAKNYFEEGKLAIVEPLLISVVEDIKHVK